MRVWKALSIHCRKRPSEPCRRGSVSAVGSQQPGAIAGDELVELAAGQALVAQDDHARAQDVLAGGLVQQPLGNLALT